MTNIIASHMDTTSIQKFFKPSDHEYLNELVDDNKTNMHNAREYLDWSEQTKNRNRDLSDTLRENAYREWFNVLRCDELVKICSSFDEIIKNTRTHAMTKNTDNTTASENYVDVLTSATSVNEYSHSKNKNKNRSKIDQIDIDLNMKIPSLLSIDEQKLFFCKTLPEADFCRGNYPDFVMEAARSRLDKALKKYHDITSGKDVCFFVLQDVLSLATSRMFKNYMFFPSQMPPYSKYSGIDNSVFRVKRIVEEAEFGNTSSLIAKNLEAWEKFPETMQQIHNKMNEKLLGAVSNNPSDMLLNIIKFNESINPIANPLMKEIALFDVLEVSEQRSNEKISAWLQNPKTFMENFGMTPVHKNFYRSSYDSMDFLKIIKNYPEIRFMMRTYIMDALNICINSSEKNSENINSNNNYNNNSTNISEILKEKFTEIEINEEIKNDYFNILEKFLTNDEEFLNIMNSPNMKNLTIAVRYLLL